MAIEITEESCLGCGCCMDVCEQGSLEFNESKDVAWVNIDTCIECEDCVSACLNTAIAL